MSELIDRKAAIDAIMSDKIDDNTLNIMIALGSGEQAKTLNDACDRHVSFLNDLPSVQPEPVLTCEGCRYEAYLQCRSCRRKAVDLYEPE